MNLRTLSELRNLMPFFIFAHRNPQVQFAHLVQVMHILSTCLLHINTWICVTNFAKRTEGQFLQNRHGKMRNEKHTVQAEEVLQFNNRDATFRIETSPRQLNVMVCLYVCFNLKRRKSWFQCQLRSYDARPDERISRGQAADG